MKFSCRKEKLEYALTIAEHFTGKNITLPILGNILMEADENTLRLSATNLEYGVRVTVSGKGSRIGKVSVPARIISSFIHSIKEEKVDLEEKQGNLFVKTDTRTTKINGLSTDDFPILPIIKITHSLVVGADQLRWGMERVLPAVSFSEFKPEFTGVFFQTATSILQCVATDTFRLAEARANLAKKIDGENFSFILPHFVSQELSRILHGENEVKISMGVVSCFW